MSSLPTAQQVALGATASMALYWLWNYWTTSNRASYPPGPMPLPLLGNILDMPRTRMPLGFAEFGDKYGPLTFIRVPGSNILVINSYEAASDLLDKRGTSYADRPRMVMMGELVGVNRDTPLKPYGHEWKLQRKRLRQALSADAIRKNYAKLLQRNWTQYLKGVLHDPDNFLTDLSSMMGKTVIEFAFGRHSNDHGIDYLERLHHVQELIVKVTFGYVVDLAPFLQYLPSWLPGMKFKRDAARWRAETDETRNILFAQAIKDMDDLGTDAQPCYSVNALRDVRDRGQEVSEANVEVTAIKHSGHSFFAAGAETTESTYQSFLLAMTLYPEVQAAAHAEIDRVIGRDRVPSFEDRDKTPYIKAMIQECLRWNPAGPIGVPHRLMEDDVYNGYFIPKGTTVFPCIWGMARNPKYYDDPSAFKPERYLEGAEPVLDPLQFVFGFGRRICPGNELAIQSVWIGMVLALWAFEIKPVGDVDPALHSDTERFTLGNLSSTVPFKCKFIPRFEGAMEKLLQASD